jgi:hypothetical protein
MTRDPVPPQLTDLMARYLQGQVIAHQDGMVVPDQLGEVVPFDAAPTQPIDPRLAWDEALLAIRCFSAGVEVRSLSAPPDWPALTAMRESEIALAFSSGNFPQMVRNLQPLLQPGGPMGIDRPSENLAIPATLRGWVETVTRGGEYPSLILAAGVLRLTRQFDAATDLLDRHNARVPAEWQSAWANEKAALAWHRGQLDQAAALWASQPESVPVVFNRGMAALFLGKPVDACFALTQAARQLPENSGWHHLSRLYLALAEMRA